MESGKSKRAMGYHLAYWTKPYVVPRAFRPPPIPCPAVPGPWFDGQTLHSPYWASFRPLSNLPGLWRMDHFFFSVGLLHFFFIYKNKKTLAFPSVHACPNESLGPWTEGD